MVIWVPIHQRGLFLNLKSCPRARSPSDIEVYLDHSCWWQDDTDKVDFLSSKVWEELHLFRFMYFQLSFPKVSYVHAGQRVSDSAHYHSCSPLGVHTCSRQQVCVQLWCIHSCWSLSTELQFSKMWEEHISSYRGMWWVIPSSLVTCARQDLVFQRFRDNRKKETKSVNICRHTCKSPVQKARILQVLKHVHGEVWVVVQVHECVSISPHISASFRGHCWFIPHVEEALTSLER